ncbi:MAG: DNA alkylation repair protein [Bacilli bacterium]
MDIKEKLFSLQDLKYKKFHSVICSSDKNIIGVRVPQLKRLAKELYKEDNEVLHKIDDEYYEEIMLQGLIIALCKVPIDKKFDLINTFVDKMDNWAICDTFCSSIKIKNNEKEIYWEFLMDYCNYTSEFKLRFLFVMLLDYYLDEKYLHKVFEIINNIDSDYYYVKMAIAWLLSVSYIKYPKDTLKALKKLNIDTWTYNKTLQKIIESNRISDDDKIFIRKLKKSCS